MSQCTFCNRADFSKFKAVVDGDQVYLSLAGANTSFPKDEQFSFCPRCGRPLRIPEVNCHAACNEVQSLRKELGAMRRKDCYDCSRIKPASDICAHCLSLIGRPFWKYNQGIDSDKTE